MANFGIGFGAFAGGLERGMRLGKAYNDESERYNKKKAFTGAINEAKTDYDKTIADNVLTQAGQQPGIGQPFDVNAANAKAKDSVGSFTDFLYQKKMPDIIDTMVQNGDIAGAQKMQKWADDGKERKFMGDFGQVLGAWSAGKSSGDYSGFADRSVKLLNSGNYGVHADGYDLVKDGDGNTTGLTFNLTDKDGKQFSHTFNSIDDAAQFISSEASPVNRFKQWTAQNDAATKLKLEQGKAAIGLGKDITMEGVKQKGRLQLQDQKADDDLRLQATKGGTAKVQQQRVAEYRVQALKDAGYNDDRIKDLLPAILGVSDTRKGASPQERVRMMRNTLMQSDYQFSRKPIEEQNAIISKLIASDDEIAAQFDKNAGGATPRPQPKLNVLR